MNPEHGVLIVDDSSDFREMVRTMLSTKGIFKQYYEAEDGEEAIGILDASQGIDLVLTDLFMPRHGGFEVIRWARNTERFRDLPILVLTVDCRTDLKITALNTGASDFMVKPFDVEELAARVRMLLERGKICQRLGQRERELAAARQEISSFSAVDRLTGLFGRGHFMESMGRELKRCRRHGVPMSIMMVDVDDLRRVNESFGWSAGDEVLREVACILGDSLRGSDMVGRYGGEEFIAYLAHTGIDSASIPAERVRSFVEKNPFAFSEGTYRATVSIGMASMDAAGPGSLEDIVDRAGAALLEAKGAGKNRVVASLQ